ncbi:TonB-dependent receptor domain-containing protein [Vibrio gallicus]|uniref:TonB-dependent receptor domain-containing protein n=1 Tax=Vibrio gallicus TaxID=190897 RepID=UPI0021C4930B|nr:TonB-dependent receptor [Vibrio gallicus]
MKKTILATAIVALYAPSLFAQEVDSTNVDETMVITANRFEPTQTSALASISVVERDQIEKLQADSAFDVLKTLPGVEVRSQGTKAGASSIFIRGANSNQTLILLDGVRLNTAASSRYSTLGLIPAFAIERIEVIRGPRAAVYGADAIGGVISITTKPQESSVHEVTLNGGSNNYHQEGWRSSGALSDTAQGHILVSNEGSKGYNISSDPNGQDFGYKSQFVSGGFNKQLSDNWNAGFNGVWQQLENQYVGTTPADTAKLQETDAYNLAANLDYTRDTYNSSLQVSFANEDQADGLDQKNAQKDYIESKRTSVLWVNHYSGIEGTDIIAGVDYSYEQAEKPAATTDFDKNSRNNAAVFTGASINLNPVTLEANVRHDENSIYGGNTTWGAGAGWFIIDSLQLTTNYGTSFKAPSFTDLYGPFGGNKDLKAEEAKSFEVGLNGYHSWANWSLVAYKNDIDNLITWVSQPTASNPWNGSLENINKAQIKGIELTVDFATGPINHTLVGDWKDTEDKSTGEQLLRRAKQNYKWIVDYSYQALDLSVSTIYVGKRADFSKTLDSYITLDFATKYGITDNLDAKFKINNLLDEDYDIADGGTYNWVGQERSYYAGLDYRF